MCVSVSVCVVRKNRDSHFWKLCKCPEYKQFPSAFGRDYENLFKLPSEEQIPSVSEGNREENSSEPVPYQPVFCWHIKEIGKSAAESAIWTWDTSI